MNRGFVWVCLPDSTSSAGRFRSPEQAREGAAAHMGAGCIGPVLVLPAADVLDGMDDAGPVAAKGGPRGWLPDPEEVTPDGQ